MSFNDGTLYGENASKEEPKYERKSTCDNFAASITFM
jgi:hypothetical protein